ncbi:MAG: hypothetical protein C9356_14965 [Oleiphilus sp.]|nr:MAG: hypothetical protein C9356_14965 [Oleiphilus sp.]
MKPIRFSVNAEGIKRTLKNTFTNETSFLTELVQNAERAGSDRVEIDIDTEKRIVIVTDYGCGLGDEERLEAFFTAGCDSKWSDEVMAEQLPFGIGSAACLYASTELVILSNGIEFVIDSQQFIETGKPVSPVACAVTHEGAMIGLRIRESVNLDRVLQKAKKELFEAFPIPVYVNGKAVSQPRSVGNTEVYTWFEMGIGKVGVQLNDSFLKDGHKRGVDYYLQGYPVAISPFSKNRTKIIVHLDSRQFSARVPDRNVLIDDEASRQKSEKVEAFVKELILQGIAQVRQSMDIRAFSAEFYDVLRCIDPDSISDLPLPRKKLGIKSEMPYKLMDYEGDSHTPFDDDKELGVALFQEELPELIVDYPDIYEYAENMHQDEARTLDVATYCYFARIPMLTGVVGAGKIADSVLNIENESDQIDLSVNAVNAREVANVTLPNLGCVALVFCDEFKVQGHKGDVPLPVATVDDAMWLHAQTLYIPKSTHCCEDVVRQQLYTETDDDYSSALDEGYFERVVEQISAAIEMHRHDDAGSLLEAILGRSMRELHTAREKLEGKTFSLELVFKDHIWDSKACLTEHPPAPRP